jgi:hypothetical protein
MEGYVIADKKEETRHFSPWAPSSIHSEEKFCVERGRRRWGPVFGSSLSLFFSLLSFFLLLFLVDVVGVHTIKASAPVTLSLVVVPLLQ